MASIFTRFMFMCNSIYMEIGDQEFPFINESIAMFHSQFCDCTVLLGLRLSFHSLDVVIALVLISIHSIMF